MQSTVTGAEEPGNSLFDVANRNPYEASIAILGKTLEDFDDDHMIPVFGFGDATTTDWFG